MGEKDTVCTSSSEPVQTEEALKSWEKKLEGESPKAFKAFCLFRSMGYKRSIKACLEPNGIELALNPSGSPLPFQSSL